MQNGDVQNGDGGKNAKCMQNAKWGRAKWGRRKKCKKQLTRKSKRLKGENMDLSNKTMLHIKKNGVEFLQFRKLLEFENVINCYTLSVNNVDFKRNFPEEHTDILQESYNRICTALNIDEQTIVRPKQSHTDCIEIVENVSTKFKDVDGLATNKPNINLMLTFADCTPILLYDPINKAVANVHSGWRGTIQKIGPKAVEKMAKKFGTEPKNVIACIGPAIAKCHFEVEEDIKDIFEKTFSYLNRNCDIIEKQKELVNGKVKYHIDTNLINKLILQEIGVLPANIIESGICTMCNSNIIHSYRANGQKSGRNVAIIGLK